jgi:hypothetical protein
VRALVIVLALLLASTGCATGNPAAAPSIPPSPTQIETTTATPVPAIVGEWQRTTTCQQRVDALKRAGLGRFAAEHAAGEGWLPGVTSPKQIKDPKNPCKGAVPLKHSHFFTADGLFGSRDSQRDQVDDGTYRSVDPNTIVITKEFGDVTFHYTVQDNGLMLDPVMPKCAKSGCFAAQWAVGMASPGLTWERVS